MFDLYAQPIGPSGQETAGEYICMAHDIMTNSPHAVFTTHNDFQGTSPDDTTGLIPAWTGNAPSRPLSSANAIMSRIVEIGPNKRMSGAS